MLEATAVFILLLPYVCNAGISSDVRHLYVNGTDATALCPWQGYRSLVVSSKGKQQLLEQLIDKLNLTKVWISLTRVKKYIWLDGVEVEKSFYLSPWSEDQICGLLHLRDEVIEVDTCDLKNIGYVCGVGEKSCTDQCVTVNGRSFTYSCERRISWKEAQRRCNTSGLNLGIVRGLYTKLSKALYPSKISCKKIWIGMHEDEKWIIPQSVKRKKLEEIPYQNWEDGEPKNSGDCALATISSRRWRMVDCATFANKICIPSEPSQATTTNLPSYKSTTMTAESTSRTMHSSSQNSTTINNTGARTFAILIAVLTPTVAIVFLAAVFIFCHKRLRGWRRKERNNIGSNTTENEQLNAELHHLTEG